MRSDSFSKTVVHGYAAFNYISIDNSCRARHQVPVGQAELRFDVCQVVHIVLAGQFTSCEAGEPEVMLNILHTDLLRSRIPTQFKSGSLSWDNAGWCGTVYLCARLELVCRTE